MSMVTDVSKSMLNAGISFAGFALPGSLMDVFKSQRGMTATRTAGLCKCAQVLEGETIAIVGRSRKSVRAITNQIRASGGDEVVFETPEEFLEAVAVDNLHVNACMMVQDDYFDNEFSVADLAARIKRVAPYISVFGLSSFLRQNDVAKKANQTIDGLMKLPLQQSVFCQAMA